MPLFGFLNRWNDSMATTIEPQAEAHAERPLDPIRWSPDKHRQSAE